MLERFDSYGGLGREGCRIGFMYMCGLGREWCGIDLIHMDGVRKGEERKRI